MNISNWPAHTFYPLATETANTWHQMAIELTQEIGRRITTITQNIRETTFPFQRLSMAPQRRNAVSSHNTMVLLTALGCESAENWLLPSTFTIAVCYYYLGNSWCLFYRPTEGGRLSRPRHCSKSAQPVPKAAYRSGCHGKDNRLRCDSYLGPLTLQSDALSTRPLRSVLCIVIVFTSSTTKLLVNVCQWIRRRYRVTVNALLSLVGPAHQLLLPLSTFKCDVFWANKFDLIWLEDDRIFMQSGKILSKFIVARCQNCSKCISVHRGGT